MTIIVLWLFLTVPLVGLQCVIVAFPDHTLSGAWWLSGRLLDSRPKGRWFEPHRRHCVVSLSKNINPSLVLVQPRKTRPYITERLLMRRKESIILSRFLKPCLPSFQEIFAEIVACGLFVVVPWQYPQNQVILDCIMPSIPLKHKC